MPKISQVSKFIAKAKRIKYFDDKFTKNKAKYISQCFLATMAVLVILLLLDIKTNAALVAALGASSFIAFTMPHAQVSHPRFLIGGYAVGIVCGIFCHFLSNLQVIQQNSVFQDQAYIIFSALAVGLAIFTMVITDTEHPPAASVALGLVLNDCMPQTIIIVLLGIVSLCSIKTILKPSLINLL